MSALTAWWSTPEWHAYERAYGDEPGTRARLLAEAAWSTRILDLSLDDETLWRDVRKSYHSLINQRPYLVTEIVSDGGIKPLEGFRRAHIASSGRETRPEATWRIQEAWMAARYGRAFSALDVDMNDAAFAYVITYGPWAYYASGVSLAPTAMHVLQWKIINILKASGTRWYELGWQGYAKDEKGAAVEFFKRGFGGRDVLLSEIGDVR